MILDPDDLADDLQAMVDQIDRRTLVTMLSILRPDHSLVVAARLAIEIGQARHDEKRALAEASKDVHGALPRGGWRRLGDGYRAVPYTEQRRAEIAAATARGMPAPSEVVDSADRAHRAQPELMLRTA